MSHREELLDMAVHALTPLMRGRAGATAEELFDEAVEIGEKLIAAVETEAARPGAPERDELMDMGIHAFSALLNGRQPARADEVLDECIAQAVSLVKRVDATLGAGADDDAREELMDVAVHVQTAFLTGRPKTDPDTLSAECVAVAQKLTAKVDGRTA